MGPCALLDKCLRQRKGQAYAQAGTGAQAQTHAHTYRLLSNLMHDRDISICSTGIVHAPGGAAVAAKL